MNHLSCAFSSYQSEGYALFPGLIPAASVDRVLHCLKRFKSINLPYYSQSEHNWRLPQADIDEHGLLSSSMENFTNLAWDPWIARSGRNILQGPHVLQALQSISQHRSFCLWQNMLFDKSTATVDHLDAWYLDTNPPGDLIACWVALEDIDGNGGAFHVYPSSHLDPDLSWQQMDHDEFIEWASSQTEKYTRKSMYLKKGDVLLWHPYLLHGSSPQVSAGSSRKSLTAHYHPSSLLRGGKGVSSSTSTDTYKLTLAQQRKDMRSFGFPIFSSSTRRQIFKTSLHGLRKIYGTLPNPTSMIMNRDHR